MRESLFAENILLISGENFIDGPNTLGQNRKTAFTTDSLWSPREMFPVNGTTMWVMAS